MKRRNADCGKLRRPVKRSKITEGIYGSSTFLYLKFLLVWSLVLMADFIVEFRFEYLWPFWLLLRSVYDSFKYQGLAFSVFFVCIAVTSDVVCYLFIPVQWLFFAASTYVWVQYVWHTERGICLPTVSLWLLFVYVEASVRLRDFKGLPVHMDLCRPFAAHCIGYPVVTLGFGFKSYVSYRLRLRKQKDVQKENEFYTQLLQQALPPELQTSTDNDKHKALPSRSSTNEEAISNGSVPSPGGSSSSHSTAVSLVSTTPSVSTTSTHNSSTATSTTHSGGNSGGVTHSKKTSSITSSSKQLNSDSDFTLAANNSTSSSSQKDLKKQNNMSSSSGLASPHIEDYLEQNLGSGKRGSSTNVNSYEEENLANDANTATKSYSKSNGVGASSSSRATTAAKLNTHNSVMTTAAASGSSKRSSGGSKSNNSTANTVTFPNNRDESMLRLEGDVKRLKSDLQSSRNTEQELRSQLNSLQVDDKVTKSELYQLRRDNESLQTKLHNLVTSRQQDKQTISSLERRLADERKLRSTAEQQLADKKKKEEAAAVSSRAAAATATANSNRGECSDTCKARRRDAENEIKQSRRDLQLYEDQIRQLERETQVLHQYKDAHNETEVLMSALSAMQEKMTHLETSLSAETRLKLDLFSALGDAKRQIEIQQGMLMQKDAQIAEFKSKIAEVMAVMPATSSPFTSPTASSESCSPHFSSGFAAPTPPPSATTHSPSPRLAGVMGIAGHSGTPPPHHNGEAMEVRVKSMLNPNASDYTPKLPQ